MDTSFLEQDLEQLRGGAVERLTAATDGFVRWAERVRDPRAPFRMRWAAGFAICVDLLGIQRETWRGSRASSPGASAAWSSASLTGAWPDRPAAGLPALGVLHRLLGTGNPDHLQAHVFEPMGLTVPRAETRRLAKMYHPEYGWRGAWRYRHANDDTAYKRLGAEVRAALA